MQWSLVYKKAYNEDGSLFFPERLTHEFLENAKKTMGSFMFANQYLNEVFPDEDRKFKPEWFKYYDKLPTRYNTFAFIDPAISTEDGADYTAINIVRVDENGYWYLLVSKRERITPTQIIEKCFEMQEIFNCQIIGIEEVAYQKALLYMLDEEMRRRGKLLPVKGIRPSNDRSKETRILGLVPRFEWGRIYLSQGLDDLEQELLQFPRGRHDDLVDSLAYLEQIVFYPAKEKENTNVHNPHDKRFESENIKRLIRKANDAQYDS